MPKKGRDPQSSRISDGTEIETLSGANLKFVGSLRGGLPLDPDYDHKSLAESRRYEEELKQKRRQNRRDELSIRPHLASLSLYPHEFSEEEMKRIKGYEAILRASAASQISRTQEMLQGQFGGEAPSEIERKSSKDDFSSAGSDEIVSSPPPIKPITEPVIGRHVAVLQNRQEEDHSSSLEQTTDHRDSTSQNLSLESVFHNSDKRTDVSGSDFDRTSVPNPTSRPTRPSLPELMNEFGKACPVKQLIAPSTRGTSEKR